MFSGHSCTGPNGSGRDILNLTRNSCCHKYRLYEILPIQRIGGASRILLNLIVGLNTVPARTSGTRKLSHAIWSGGGGARHATPAHTTPAMATPGQGRPPATRQT